VGGDLDQPASDGGTPDRPILVRVEDLDDFILCPLYYAFKNVYGIKPSKPNDARWTDILKDSILWFYYKIMARQRVTWGALVDHWETSWAETVRKDAVDAHSAMMCRDLGIRGLFTLFDEIVRRMDVLAVNYPVCQRIGPFGLCGTIPIIRGIPYGKGHRHGEMHHRNKRYSIQFVDIVSRPKSTSNASLSCMLFTYGLAPTLWRDLWRTSVHPIKPLTYIIQENRYAVMEWDQPEDTLRWAGWVLESIHQGHFYPRTGKHCTKCPYLKICNTEHVSTTKLLASTTLEELQAQLEE